MPTSSASNPTAPHQSATENLHVSAFETVLSPRELKDAYPLSAAAERTVFAARQAVRGILHGTDPRLLVIAGPCSIHDAGQALAYAHKLAALRSELSGQLEIVMRVYVDKPRTTVGWRGYLTDPHLNGAYDFSGGLSRTRELMLAINDLGLPVATELLDPFVPQYLFDLLSWVCIGARTAESQTHRVMASAVSAPVGFKNGTSGNLKIAVDAAVAAKGAHAFFTITDDARACIVHTRGNPDGHVVLRGGSAGPNYGADSVSEAARLMQLAHLTPAVVVDCSHANSGSDHTRQHLVWQDVLAQRRNSQDSGDQDSSDQRTGAALRGVMIESHLNAGKQSIPADLTDLQYGVSVTDACIGWDETEALLRGAAVDGLGGKR
ncbi:3-deoxy-7-phosphoheptulonate synthase [Deinococcus detaillensis]|uniref:Phospho-2-dehydro-3-deoxyheptonate aldolase n=1 Tax=Deinococcus detaillensis TaxID=2592048 RepID=A0A553ULP6_9DEIO|nr:3-deoxy-7-phosphoheptulonate synthase [Deinococcus detaillensis]TSA81136.1 3-deoxy-7-phosphoheptulonate synthase [Deinococcus detaillensis]